MMIAFLGSPRVTPVLLLLASNLFMTFAWYGHLKFPKLGAPTAILVSWAIALIEYCLAVPANRIGYGVYSAAQLKTIQEVITLLIFSGFSVFVLGEMLTWRHALGFALIVAGASLVFQAK
jgi:uncharacterized protein (DUF486 family)